MFSTRIPFLLAAASLLSLAACDDSTGSGQAAQGTVTFTYSGAETGAYEATGRFDRLRPDRGTFAVAGRGELETGGDGLVVFAHAQRADGRADELLLSVTGPRVGEFRCDEDAAAADCPIGALFFVGTDVEGETEGFYSSVEGTVSITSINEDRARGTFSFRLEGFDLEPTEVQVTSGTFDVPIVPGIG
jgi:hypothetical protein